MPGLIFEASSDDDFADVYVYSSNGVLLDITASVSAEIGGGGIVGLYGDDPSIDNGGSNLFGDNGSIYFDGADANGLSVLYVYNQSTAALSAIEPANSWGSGLTPDDFVALGKPVYFVGKKSNGYQELYVTKGTEKSTKSVSNAWVDNGQMADFDNQLFFDGQSLRKTLQGYETGKAELVSYNPITGVFRNITLHTAKVSAQGFDPLDMTSALSDGPSEPSHTYLFMAGTDKAGDQNLFAYTGSSLIEIGGGAASGLDPLDITAGRTTGVDAGVYFSGVDSDGQRGLFFANGQVPRRSKSTPTATEVTPSSFGGSSEGLDPYDITAFEGNIYFTGDDNATDTTGQPGRGLFEYDPTTNQTTELISSDTLNFAGQYHPGWGSGNPITMAAFDNQLYFVAFNPNAAGAASVDQLYAYSGSGAAPNQFITGASLNSSPNPMVLGSF